MSILVLYLSTCLLTAEIYHFQHERVVDFRMMMKGMLEAQIVFYKQVCVWKMCMCGVCMCMCGVCVCVVCVCVLLVCAFNVHSTRIGVLCCVCTVCDTCQFLY